MATEYSEQIIREDPKIEAFKIGLLERARDLSQEDMNLPAYQAAGLSPTQQQASQLAQYGLGSYQPYLEAAGMGISQGQNLAQTGARGLAGINTAPEFMAAQQAMQTGLSAAGQLPAYAPAAGYGYDQIGRGAQTLAQGVAGAGGITAAGMPGQQLAQQTVGQGIGGLLGSAQAYDPTRTQEFMNPYQQMVTQQATQEMRRQADIARQQMAAQAARTGAFGGTREGVQRAETERGLQDIMSQRIFQDYSQNYLQAQQAGMGSFEQQQQRQLAASQGLGQMGGLQSQIGSQQANLIAQQAGLQGQLGSQQAQMGLLPAQIASQQAAIAGQGAQLYGSLGQGIGALGAQRAGVDYQTGMGLGQLGSTIGQLGIQQAALGQAQQQLGAADVSMLSQLGAIEQQNMQQQLEAARATALQQSMSPYQRLGFLSDIYKGAPSSQMTLSAQTAPSVSPLAQAVGLGISGLSAAGAASKLF